MTRRFVLAMLAVGAAATASPAVAEVLEPARGKAIRPALAMGPGGGVLAWTSGSAVRVLRLDARGRRDGRIRVLARKAVTSGGPMLSPVVAVDDAGRAVVAWRRRVPVSPDDGFGGNCCASVEAAVLDRRGRVRATAKLSILGEDVEHPPVAAMRGGRAAVAWGTGAALSISTASVRKPFAVPRVVVAQEARPVAAAFRAGGPLELTWLTYGDGDGDGEHLRRVDVDRDSTPAAPRTLVPVEHPSVASASDGTLLLTELGPSERIDARLAPPGRPPGPVRRIPKGDVGRVAAADAGRGVIVSSSAGPRIYLARIGPRGLRPRRAIARLRAGEELDGVALRGGDVAIAMRGSGDRRAHRPSGGRVLLTGRRGRPAELVLPGPWHRPTALAFAGRRLLVARQTTRGLELRRLGRG